VSTQDAESDEGPFLAYLDESGSLVDARQDIIVAAALVVREQDVPSLRPILPCLRRKLNQQRKRDKKISGEFKFEVLHGRQEFAAIKEVLLAISKLPCHLVVVSVQKGQKVIEDSPLNYAVLLTETVRLCRQHYPKAQYIFDRHYIVSQFDKMQRVNHTLAQILGEPLDVLHEDSQNPDYPGLGLVDFVAGAWRFLTQADEAAPGYEPIREGREALRGLVLEDKAVNWEELKGRYYRSLRAKIIDDGTHGKQL